MSIINKANLSASQKNENKSEIPHINNYSIVNQEYEDKFLEEHSLGICYLCQKEISGKNIKNHLMNDCLKKINGEKEAFLIKASAGPYWIYFTIPKENIISEMYLPLKKIWPAWYNNMKPCRVEPFTKILPKKNNIASEDLGIEKKEDLAVEFISQIKISKKQMLILGKNKTPLVEKF